MSSKKTERILFISPVAPRRDGTGIEQRAWSHLEVLSRAGDVQLLLAVTDQQIERGLDMVQAAALVSHLTVVTLRPSSKLQPRRIPGLTLFERLVRLRDPAYTPDRADLERFRGTIQHEHFGLVFCYRLRSFALWDMVKTPSSPGRVFVDFDDIESLAIRREIPFERHHAGLEQSWIARLEAIEARMLESRAQRTVDMVSVCSEIDRARIQAAAGRATIVVVPNSCPLPEPLALRPTGPVRRLLFVGTMSYAPNADALIYFCERVLPLLRQRCRTPVELVAVGRNPGPEVLALAADSAIRVTGGVESVQPYYEEADLVVAPIRSGGGTRIKILEALGFQRAVVSTTLGAEGLNLVPGRDLIIADDAEAFANACSDLLENDEKRHRLARQGREQVAAVYDRNRVQQELLAAIFASA